MATQQGLTLVSMEANGDISTKQFYIVELNATADRINVCDNAGDIPFGVLQDTPDAAGVAASVAIGGGIVKVVSDGSGTAIAVKDLVGTDANGKAVKKASDADWILGQAMDASSADGKIIRVAMHIHQRAS